MDVDFSSKVKRWWFSLAREQQSALVILLVCGSLGSAFSFAYLRMQIRSPFQLSIARVERAERALQQRQSQETAEDPTETELRGRDTDHDGLSDWIEKNVYRTSAYLADSDSDSIPDSVEIAQGTDPNCPQGRQCGVVEMAEAVGTTSTTFKDLLSTDRLAATAQDVRLGEASGTSDVQAFLESPPEPSAMNGPQVREYLKTHHLVPDDQLSQLPDESLKQIYEAAYQEALRIRAARQRPSPTAP